MIHPVPDHSNDGIFRIFGKSRCLGKIAIFERGEDLLERLRVASATLAPPPKDSLANDRDGEKSRYQNGPHDWPPLLEALNQYIC
jgi:hypothetical protein